MSDELDDLLERYKPPPAPPALRGRVLASVKSELAPKITKVSTLRIGAALAASLFLSVGLNFYLDYSHKARLSQLYGPRPVPRQIADLRRCLEKITDKETAALMEQRLLQAALHQQRPPANLGSFWISIDGPETKRN